MKFLLLLILLFFSIIANIFLLLKLKKLSKVNLETCATIETNSDLSNPTTDTFISSFLKLINNIIKSVEDVSINIENINQQSTKLTNSSQENISDLSKTQLQISDMLTLLSDNFQLSENIAETFEKSNSTMLEKQKNILKSISEYTTVQENISIAKNSIDRLVDSTNQVEEIIHTISSISQQTNMLALNASIEAARAGEYGKGFSVVATEVKNLSNQTKNATNQISDVLKNVRNDAAITQNDITNTVDILNSQSTMLQDTVSTINNISELFKEVKSNITNLKDKNNQSYLNCSEINCASCNVVDSIKDDTNSIREIDDSVKEQGQSIKELNDSTINLKNISNNLFDCLNVDANTIVAVTEEYPPFVIETDNINNQGIDIDMCREICKRHNFNFKLFFAPFDLSIDLVQNGAADMISTISYTQERSQKINFTSPYRDESRYLLFKNINSKKHFHSYSDMNGCTIGIIDGYTYPNKFINDKNIHKDKNFKLDTLFNKIIKNQIDAILINEYIGNYYIKSNNLSSKINVSSYTLIADEKFDARLGFSRAKNTDKFLKCFNQEIKKLEDDGTLKKIESKYTK